jgi:hypothetical protein
MKRWNDTLTAQKDEKRAAFYRSANERSAADLAWLNKYMGKQ